jgi:hypothetical protein
MYFGSHSLGFLMVAKLEHSPDAPQQSRLAEHLSPLHFSFVVNENFGLPHFAPRSQQPWLKLLKCALLLLFHSHAL